PATKPTQAQAAGAAPKDNASETAKETLTVTIARTEPFLYLGSKPISLQDLEAELKRAASLKPAVILSLRADKDALFSEIVKVADTARQAGIKSVTLITEQRVARGDSVRATNTNVPVESHPGNAAPTKPSPSDPNTTVRQNHEPQPDTTTLVQDGKVLYEMGRIDEAEARLKQATKQDPENQTAFYYLTLIEEARYAAGARKSEALPTPNPFAITNLAHTGPGRQAIRNKLHRIVLNEALFDGVPLPQVLQFLSQEASRRDPDKEGINFLINPNVVASAARTTTDPTTGQPITLPPPEPLDMNSVIVRINPPLKNVRLADLLEAITRVANKPIRYSIEEYAVIFSQKPAETSQLKTRIFKVDPETVIQRMHRALRDSGESEIEIFGNSNDGTVDVIRKFFESVGINVFPPNVVFYKDRTGMLVVRATAEELDRVQEAIDALNSVRGEQPGPDSGVHSTGSREAAVIDAGEKRSTEPVGALETRIYKLDLYVLRRNLQKLSGGASVADASASVPDVVRNFLQARGVTFQAPNTMFLNEQTGVLLVRATADELKIVHRAVVVLNTGQDAEDFGIFSPVNEVTDAEPTQADSKAELITRVFRLNPQTFIQNLRDTVHGGTADEKTDAVQQLVRDFLAAAGVNVRPPNLVFFNHRTGALLIRAPAKEMDVSQKAIEVLNVAPQQIIIEAKFMEMPTDAARKLGLDLPPPGATSNTWTRVLTAVQMQTFLRSALQQAGADILSAPKITTLSGRQTQIQAVEIKDIVNSINPQAFNPPGVRSTNGVPAQPYLTGQIPVGPTLDMVAYVAADGYTIHLSAIPQVTEVSDAATASQFVPTVVIGAGGAQPGVPITGPLPLPIMRTRQMAAGADVYDGQTLVLANPMVIKISQPPGGQSVTNSVPEDSRKRLLVFITPTLIDPAGNPIHTKDNLPNDPNSIPPTPRNSP
ncbi:MAG: hypothetical protein DME23_00985, partial [Verrucomicrobia bacterium]